MKKKIFHILCLLLIVCFLVSCGKIALYQNLTEEEANEILVLLADNNIKASKKSIVLQNEMTFAVEVNESDMVKARGLLLSHNLPRHKELGLSGVYKEKGLIPTPDEQKARYTLALKGDIINSLVRIPQIVDAAVVLNIPTKDEFADAEKQKLQRPTASVVVRVKPSTIGVEEITESKIQQFVANAVEGLNPRDVAVMISYLVDDKSPQKPTDVKTIPSDQSTVAGATQGADANLLASQKKDYSQELIGLKLDQASKTKLKVYLLFFFLLLVILSAALIVVIVQSSRTRRELLALKGPAGNNPAIEGHLMDDGPPQLGGGEGQ